jgi:hypothetical protein
VSNSSTLTPLNSLALLIFSIFGSNYSTNRLCFPNIEIVNELSTLGIAINFLLISIIDVWSNSTLAPLILKDSIPCKYYFSCQIGSKGLSASDSGLIP